MTEKQFLLKMSTLIVFFARKF